MVNQHDFNQSMANSTREDLSDELIAQFGDDDLLNMEIPSKPESITVKEGSERLVISHIEVENFKSYFGKQVIGPFHKCFTSIIGPNGSGKSNVIDALLFVFGYRAAKIRSKKVSVLIHSSAGRDDIHSCTVTVHFCKIIDSQDNNFTKVAGSDISVSRSAYKNNTSKYMMNGRTVQFKEVAELLRSTGIDLIHNRFLILQGEVEQISMMKPKAEKEEEEGMLEYLEDIIGSSRLKPFIKKLQNKIERINEQRVLQVQRVQHAEKEKLHLDGPARGILSQMRLENAITCVTNKIYLSKKCEVEDKISELSEIKGNFDKDLYEAQEKMTEITNHSKQVSKERQQLQSKLDKCHETVQFVEKQKAEQEQFIKKTENDKKRLEDKRGKLLEKVENERKKLLDIESAPEISEQKIEELRKQLTEAEAEIEECSPILMKKLEEVRTMAKAEEKDKAELEAKLGKITEEEDLLNSQLVLAQQKLMNLKSEEESQRRKFETLQTDLLDTEELLIKKEKDLESLETQLPEHISTFDGKTARLKHLQARDVKLDERIREVRRQFEELKQTEERFNSTNKLVNRMMEAKRTGEIPGIYGRLGDLGAIDEKYDTAVSTNYPQLEFIVVDDVETAQRCIELLKKEQLGISTFIALKRQQHLWQQIKRTPQTPENAKRLIDLINVNDEQVLPAFYFILGDTLIADDIETATRIATGTGRRWRCVTLSGELVDTSGAMTGGGTQKVRSRIGREVRVDTSQQGNENNEEKEQQIATLEQDLSNAQAELNGVRRECNQLDSELRKRQDDLKQHKETIKLLQLEIESAKSKIVELRRQLEAQKSNVINSAANPEEVKKVQGEIDDFKSRGTKVSDKADSLRTQLMDINDRIEEVNNRIAGPYKKRKENAEEMKKCAEKGINKEKANIATSARNKKKVEVIISNLEGDIEDTETEFKTVSDRNLNAKNKLGELDELLDQRRNELEFSREKLDEYVKSISERNEEEVELQKQIENLQRELKEVNGKLATNEAKCKSYVAKISKLRLYRLKRLTEALSKEVNALNIHVNDEDEENDENLELDEDDEPVERQTRKNLQGGLQQITDDGLAPFLEECREEEEAIEQEEVPEQMEIDENEEEEMEEDGPVVEEIPQLSNRTATQQQCFMKLPHIDEVKIRQFDIEQLEQDLGMLESKKKKERINLALIIEYMQKLERYESEFQSLSKITEMRNRHRALHDRLKKQRLHEFMEGFQQIATQLRTTYQMITIQGDVSLELVDSLDPFAEGIAFNVRPPKKSWKQITNLSGGEKTLASLALVFGLHHYKPTPLYVMDEIDAALDFRNVSIIANYLMERTRNAQFIVISLRNQMYEKANRLIGIYKVKDCTSNVCVDLHRSSDDTTRNIKREFVDAC